MRYLIKLTILAGLFIPVLASAQTQTLPMGWSIVGNNTGAAINANAVFGNATAPTAVTSNVTTVWTWNNALNQWNFFAPSMTPQELSMYAASKGYGVLSSVSKDEGFWVNAKAQFLYSPTSTASVDVKPLQGSNSSTYTKSSTSGTGCAALGLQTASSTSGYVSVSVVTSGSRATVNMWDSSSYFVFIFNYQSGNNTTGYNLTGTFKENITGLSGSSNALSFRQTSWGSYVGFLTATTNNCTISAAIN